MGRNLLWIASGGIIGSLLRYGTDILPMLLFDEYSSFLTTVFVNMAGCFIMGIAVVRLQSETVEGDAARLFLVTGLLGSFTTFSGYTIQALELLQTSFSLFFIYFFGQVILGVFLLIAGAKISASMPERQSY